MKDVDVLPFVSLVFFHNHFGLCVMSLPYLCYLDTPVEKKLRANIIFVFMHIVQKASMRHQLGNQLNGGTQTHSQKTNQVGMIHASHN